MVKKILVLFSVMLVVGMTMCRANDSPFPEAFKSGYVGITDNPDLNKMFYFLALNRDTKIAEPPLIIWLNGGPGCSSMGGAGAENGPFYVDPSTNMAKVRDIAWNQQADVLYVDNPLATGFSFGEDSELAKDGEDVKKYFYQFLTNLLSMPEFQKYKKRPLWISGESYAGHYIPQIANYLIGQGNKDINLQGIAIGNNLTDRWPQSIRQPNYLRFKKDLTKFDDNLYDQLKDRIALLQSVESDGYVPNRLYAVSKYSQLSYVQSKVTQNYNQVTQSPFGFNPYDVRKQCKKMWDCELTHQLLEGFYNQPQVKTALGVDQGLVWKQCGGKGGTALNSGIDFWATVSDEFEIILNSGLPVLIYNGMEDSVCDFMGVEYLLNNLRWYGAQAWNQQQYIQGKYGEEKKYMNLKFIKIEGAGHMVPTDQPQIGLDMMYDFMGIKNQ